MVCLGDYNTNVWLPRLDVDAITFLSNQANATMTGCGSTAGWCDGSQPASPNGPRENTTVNAAILAGHSAPRAMAASGCGTNTTAAGGKLPPLPGKRGSVTFTYTVRWFHSVPAVCKRSSGTISLWRDYYDPPTRNWQFDINFRFRSDLPPGNPVSRYRLQTRTGRSMT